MHHHITATEARRPIRELAAEEGAELHRQKLIMDLNSIEGLNEIRPSVYRAAMKLQSLQKLCHMDVVFVRHVTAALLVMGGANQQQDVVLSRQEVMGTLNRMFHSVSQEVPGHVTVAAPEEMCSLMFKMFDRSQSGRVAAVSLQVALICLSADSLMVKYRVNRSSLRSLLQDLSQVPTTVQEGAVFGSVEAAVLTPTASKEHVLAWLQSEPRLLLWLPTLYRLSVSKNVSHSVRCHTCKTFPISGLRYRCMKCVNVQVCQSCFLTDKQTRKHKTHHPVLEFCTQPTWRESLSLLVHSACHSLLPWRYTEREANRRRDLMRAEPEETRNSALSDVSTRLGASAVRHSPSSVRCVSCDASGPPPCSSSKALQTEETPPKQASALLTEVRNLQRDKWLLEQQLQAWRCTVQTEQGILENRCSEMEVTMETLREHNDRLQGMLTQAMYNMEAHHTKNTPHCCIMENTKDTERVENTERMENIERDEENMNKEVLMRSEEEWSENEQQTLSPTIPQGTPSSHDTHCVEEHAGDTCLCHPIRQQDIPQKAEPQEEDTDLSEEEDHETGSEEMLQETVDRLKTVMETDRWRNRQAGERREAELQVAAEQVGGWIYHLVDIVRH
ncbi:hypothetical protein PAMP_016773 [Pampus punctatissimus]